MSRDAADREAILKGLREQLKKGAKSLVGNKGYRKYLAAEASFYAADRAVQTLGGMGYASEYHVERYWREARLQRIAPVTQEMTLNYLAQNVMGLPRSY